MPWHCTLTMGKMSKNSSDLPRKASKANPSLASNCPQWNGGCLGSEHLVCVTSIGCVTLGNSHNLSRAHFLIYQTNDLTGMESHCHVLTLHVVSSPGPYPSLDTLSCHLHKTSVICINATALSHLWVSCALKQGTGEWLRAQHTESAASFLASSACRSCVTLGSMVTTA